MLFIKIIKTVRFFQTVNYIVYIKYGLLFDFLVNNNNIYYIWSITIASVSS